MLEAKSPDSPAKRRAGGTLPRSLRIGEAKKPVLHRAAPGELQPRPRRPVVRAQRLSPSTSASRASATRCPTTLDEPLRRRRLRRTDERQRQGRVHPPGDRVDRRGARGGEAVPRHLPRRADAGQPSRRQGRLPSRGAGRDRLLPARHDARTGCRFGPFPDHVYQWHREGCELASGARLLATSDGAFPNQAFAYGLGRSACSSTPRSPTRRCTAGPATTTRACGMKGARERHEHIARPYRPRAQGARLARSLPVALGRVRTHD